MFHERFSLHFSSSFLAQTPVRVVALLVVLATTISFLSSSTLPSFKLPSVYDVHHMPPATIAKVSMSYGGDRDFYDRALASHDAHNARFGYPFFVLQDQLLNDFWSKPAYILRVLLAELEKPQTERLQWLLWVDADTVLMNPNIPLEIFLPPEDDDWNHIHALVTNDEAGLNNGVFFLRVHEWSVWLISLTLTSGITKPDLNRDHLDQNAMAYWLRSEDYRNNTMHVPQRWFNAYKGRRKKDLSPESHKKEDKPNAIREGDLFVHFAGVPDRTHEMMPWIEAAEKHLPQWELPLEQTTYRKEIARFWTWGAHKEHDRVDDELKEKAEREKEAVAMERAAAQEGNERR